MKSNIGLPIILIFLLSACTTSHVAVSTKQIPQTPTPTNVIFLTISATKTLTASLTPESLAEPDIATATQQALHEKLDKYCNNQAWGFRSSLNNLWDVVICSYDVIKIVHNDETKVWDMSSSRLVDPYTDHFVNVSHWSNDGTYVYVVIDPHTDGYWEPFHQGIVLYRLTLETGQVSEVLPLVRSNWVFYSFAFSPNDRRLAYIVTDKSPVILHIQDMQTGDGQSFEFDSKYNTGGGFVWSPDSQNLIFSITQFDTNNYAYIATSLILWNRETSESTTLIKDHSSFMQALEWADENTIILQAEVFGSTETKTTYYELDLESKGLTEINP